MPRVKLDIDKLHRSPQRHKVLQLFIFQWVFYQFLNFTLLFFSELFDVSPDQLEPDSKRLKLRLLSYFFDYDQYPASSLERELREYMAAPAAPETTQPAEYWRWSPLSQLSTLAKSVLALPLGWSPVQTVLVTDHHKIQGLRTQSLKQTEQTIFLNVNKKLW